VWARTRQPSGREAAASPLARTFYWLGSLTSYDVSSTPNPLKIMSLVALVFVPVVLAYQAWTHWVFRHRVTPERTLEY
jgi:cytochrome bd-type quinol oxidase subunit 2